MKSFLSLATPLVALLSTATALELDITNKDSVKAATSAIAYDMMTYYKGNLSGMVPGILPGPCQSDECYYWWEAGAMWGALINYWQYTGDTSYQDSVIQSLQFQVGPAENYNPPNQSKNMGVDDQDFWGFAAMEAAEAGIPDIGGDAPSWLSLGQAVFNFQTDLWDTDTCNGGFRWQVFPVNPGYNLKNTISNGGFFNLAARLARYTDNSTYADWANKVYDWMEQSVLFAYQEDNKLYVWDNTDADKGCQAVENFVWTYNYGTLLFGSAMMYNYTNGDQKWQNRIQVLLDGAFHLFFPTTYDGATLDGNTMIEMLCEQPANCNNDQRSFKAYLSRWMAVTTLIAPFTHDQIMPKLQASANAAAKACSGGPNGRMCGSRWYSGSWDGSMGVGQQMSALSVIGATQITADMVPKSLKSGGTSKSDPNAGSEAPHNVQDSWKPITTADRAGAGILTFLTIASVVGLAVWIVI